MVISAPPLTLDRAIARAREIQRDLDAGRLTVPYPVHVREDLKACVRVFADYCTTPEKAAELGLRLNAPELPW